MNSLLLALVLSAAAVPKPNTTPPVSKEDRCFVESMCELKESIRWKTPRWSEAMCNRVGNAIIAEEKTSGVPRDLLLSVMINESDMNEKAVRFSYKGNKLVAWDGGLMGIRCRIGEDGRSCTNYAKRFTWKDLLVPEINIRLAAKKMKSIRDTYPCRHTDHPWFAHYNWGGKVIRTGIPRSYPQRVAVLWKALSELQGVERPEIAKLKFVQIAGQKRVTVSTPVGVRHKSLVAKIRACKTVACKPEPSGSFVLATE